MQLFTLLTMLLAVIVIPSVIYLVVTTVAAAVGTRSRAATASCGTGPANGSELRLTVLIPAHDEELVIAATLESLRTQDYPHHKFDVVVIADNCSDATALIAVTAGARVLQRLDPNRRGKGYALQWALAKLLAERDAADAYVIVDADTWVLPDFLRQMAQRLMTQRDSRGCCALQGRYGVLNVRAGWRTAMMAGALELVNHIRPLALDRMGLTAGLKGNGMAFTREVLERAPWSGRSVTEDVDYGLDLLLHHGIRVGYVPEAVVMAQMPVTGEQAASQRNRWEGGRFRLLRERTMELMVAAVRRRDPALGLTALELLVPPLAELALLLGVWCLIIVAGEATRSLPYARAWLLVCALCGGGLLGHIVGGWRIAEAPSAVYFALLKAPAYLFWKLALKVRRLVGGSFRGSGTVEWVRTTRILPQGSEMPPKCGDTSARRFTP